jgi:hypothetical protein
MKLREFKAKYMAILLNLRKELLERYPDRAQRIEFIVDVLGNKLSNLRVYTLSDYLRTLQLATKEFRELEELVPDPSEVEELLREGED